MASSQQPTAHTSSTATDTSPRTAGDADRVTDRDEVRDAAADDPTEIPADGWKDVAMRVKDEFGDDHVTLTSAGVAFFFFLALVPLVAAGVSMYGLVADPADVTSLVDRLGPSVPDAVADLIGQQLDAVASAAGGALGLGVFIGIVSALWSASSGFGHLVEGLNIAYDVKDSRGFVQRKLLALGLTLGFLVVVALVFGVITVAAGLATGFGRVISLIVGWSIVAVVFGVFLAVLYRYGPNREEPQWVWVSPGSVFAVVAWTLMTLGFGFYVSAFGSYNETYGSLGAIVVTLTWMYLTAVVVVLGAEITTELERERLDDVGADDENDLVARPIGQVGVD